MAHQKRNQAWLEQCTWEGSWECEGEPERKSFNRLGKGFSGSNMQNLFVNVRLMLLLEPNHSKECPVTGEHTIENKTQRLRRKRKTMILLFSIMQCIRGNNVLKEFIWGHPGCSLPLCPVQLQTNGRVAARGNCQEDQKEVFLYVGNASYFY